MYSVIIVNGGYYPNVVSVDIYSDKNAASDAVNNPPPKMLMHFEVGACKEKNYKTILFSSPY